jgi:cyclase
VLGSWSIHVKRTAAEAEVVVRSGTSRTGLDPVELARRGEGLRAGEILLQSVDRDGTMQGYDLETLAAVTSAVRIPVIASGGAGTYDHLTQAVTEADASAVAAASIFHFTQQTPVEAKQFMRQAGIPVRL